MNDWVRIRQLFSIGRHSKREIGRLVGVSRGTVDRALEKNRSLEALLQLNVDSPEPGFFLAVIYGLSEANPPRTW